jgi:hypothetical protein
MMKNTKSGTFEVDSDNVHEITKDQLKDRDNAEFEAHMKHYEEICLASYGHTKSGIFKKNPLPTPKQVTFSADPDGLQDMMTKAMHQMMIDQYKVFTNTIQNCLTEALKKGAEGGYLGPAYFQPNRTPLVFQHNQPASPPIDDPTIGISPSPHINANVPSSSSDSQPTQNQGFGDKSKDPAIIIPMVQTHSMQSNIQDQTFSVQNQKYPAMRNQYGKLAGWDLTRDHYETNISNFFELQPEETPEVKYLQSYQAMFGGTPGTVHMNKEGVEFVYFNHRSKAFERVKISPAHAHMVIPTERKAHVQPQKSVLQPMLGMPVQTARLQQSTPMQPVLTPTNTVAHTRTSPQQPINHGVIGQPIIPQVDPAQVL